MQVRKITNEYESKKFVTAFSPRYLSNPERLAALSFPLGGERECWLRKEEGVSPGIYAGKPRCREGRRRWPSEDENGVSRLAAAEWYVHSLSCTCRRCCSGEFSCCSMESFGLKQTRPPSLPAPNMSSRGHLRPRQNFATQEVSKEAKYFYFPSSFFENSCTVTSKSRHLGRKEELEACRKLPLNQMRESKRQKTPIYVISSSSSLVRLFCSPR